MPLTPKSLRTIGRRSFGTFHMVIFTFLSTSLDSERFQTGSASPSTEQQDACGDQYNGFDECKQESREQAGKQDARTKAYGGTADHAAKCDQVKHSLHLLSVGTRGLCECAFYKQNMRKAEKGATVGEGDFCIYCL